MVLAIVMCGGRGERLGFVEKPMIEIKGRRLIEFILEEIESVGLDIVCVTSPYTKNTEIFLRERGHEIFRGSGKGYMNDLKETIESYMITEPVFTANSDLYIIRNGIFSEFFRFYMTSDYPAASMIYENGKPVGINAFDPLLGEQREEKFIINERDIINIDTPQDLERIRYGCIF